MTRHIKIILVQRGVNKAVNTFYSTITLEALAVGLPVIVTPGLALADVVKQEHLGYVTELDVAAIISVIKQTLGNPQETRSMGDRARQFIKAAGNSIPLWVEFFISQNYTWNQVSSNLIEIYTKIVSAKQLFYLQ